VVFLSPSFLSFSLLLTMSSSGAAALSGGGAIDKGMVLCSFDPTGEWFAYVTHDNRLKV